VEISIFVGSVTSINPSERRSILPEFLQRSSRVRNLTIDSTLCCHWPSQSLEIVCVSDDSCQSHRFAVKYDQSHIWPRRRVEMLD